MDTGQATNVAMWDPLRGHARNGRGSFRALVRRAKQSVLSGPTLLYPRTLGSADDIGRSEELRMPRKPDRCRNVWLIPALTALAFFVGSGATFAEIEEVTTRSHELWEAFGEAGRSSLFQPASDPTRGMVKSIVLATCPTGVAVPEVLGLTTDVFLASSLSYDEYLVVTAELDVVRGLQSEGVQIEIPQRLYLLNGAEGDYTYVSGQTLVRVWRLLSDYYLISFGEIESVAATKEECAEHGLRVDPRFTGPEDAPEDIPADDRPKLTPAPNEEDQPREGGTGADTLAGSFGRVALITCAAELGCEGLGLDPASVRSRLGLANAAAAQSLLDALRK